MLSLSTRTPNRSIHVSRPRIRGVIADLAGTWVDKYCLSPECAMKKTLFKHGILVDSSIIRAGMGLSKKTHIESILAHIKKILENSRNIDLVHKLSLLSTNDTLYMDYLEIQKQVIRRFCTLIPGVLPAVRQLEKQGIKVGFTTGYPKDVTDLIMNEINTRYGVDLSKYGVSSDQVVNGNRPDPFMLYKCMDLMGIQDSKTVVKVGDSMLDILEGKNAGCVTIGVNKYSTHVNYDCKHDVKYPVLLDKKREAAADMLYDTGADYVVNTFGDIVGMVNKI